MDHPRRPAEAPAGLYCLSGAPSGLLAAVAMLRRPGVQARGTD